MMSFVALDAVSLPGLLVQRLCRVDRVSTIRVTYCAVLFELLRAVDLAPLAGVAKGSAGQAPSAL